jgi:hypothetical protein
LAPPIGGVQRLTTGEVCEQIKDSGLVFVTIGSRATPNAIIEATGRSRFPRSERFASQTDSERLQPLDVGNVLGSEIMQAVSLCGI